MSTRYTAEQKQWLKEFIPGHKQREIAEMFTRIFGIPMTPAQVKQYKQNHGIPSGTRPGLKVGDKRTVWLPEYEQFLRENANGHEGHELAEMLNKKFGTSFTYAQVHSAKCRFGITSGVVTRFKKGQKPNEFCIKKGQHLSPKTEFKKGHSPKNKTFEGNIVRRGDGDLWIKYGADGLDWMPLKRYVWEQNNGPIPKGYCVVLLDGNKDNCDISNLELIDQAENAIFAHKKGLRQKDPELTKTGILIARLRAKQAKAGKRRKAK